MIFHFLKEPDNNYNEQFYLDILGTRNITNFKRVWNFVEETNEILRAVYRWYKLSHLIQIILNHHEVYINIYDFSIRKTQEKEQLIEVIILKDRE